MFRSGSPFLIFQVAAMVLTTDAMTQTKDSLFADFSQAIPGSEVSFRMIFIPGGTFRMGSPASEKGHQPDESVAATVKVDSFWMEEHEVTYDEYIHYQDEGKDPVPKPDGITRPSPPYIDFTLGMGKTGGYPANSMSQYAALMYCKWLYKKTGVFYRLPTEAEWEYACRGGTTTAYFFGNNPADLHKYAWFAANSGNKYHPVKQLQPNPFKLYDMLGNVAEWTLDRYRVNYSEDPGAAEGGNKKVNTVPITLRGGHFQNDAADLRSSARLPSNRKWNARDPQIPRSKWWNTDAPFIGFRIIKPVTQPSPEEVQNFFEQFLIISK